MTREAAWVSHIPWILSLVKWIPSGATKYLSQIQDIAEQTVKSRVAAGSAAKDIFYHLVRRVCPPTYKSLQFG